MWANKQNNVKVVESSECLWNHSKSLSYSQILRWTPNSPLARRRWKKLPYVSIPIYCCLIFLVMKHSRPLFQSFSNQTHKLSLPLQFRFLRTEREAAFKKNKTNYSILEKWKKSEALRFCFCHMAILFIIWLSTNNGFLDLRLNENLISGFADKVHSYTLMYFLYFAEIIPTDAPINHSEIRINQFSIIQQHWHCKTLKTLLSLFINASKLGAPATFWTINTSAKHFFGHNSWP